MMKKMRDPVNDVTNKKYYELLAVVADCRLSVAGDGRRKRVIEIKNEEGRPRLCPFIFSLASLVSNYREPGNRLWPS